MSSSPEVVSPVVPGTQRARTRALERAGQRFGKNAGTSPEHERGAEKRAAVESVEEEGSVGGAIEVGSIEADSSSAESSRLGQERLMACSP